jgi:hypothetical protein
MKKPFLGLSLLVGLGVFMTACGSDSGSDGGNGCPSGQVPCDGVCIDEISATLAGANGIQEAVFTPTCTFSNCHGTEGIQAEGLELSSVEISEENLIGVDSVQVPSILLVDSGSSASSYLVDKLLGTDNVKEGTQTMPFGQMLCDARIEAVEQWINDGAPIN